MATHRYSELGVCRVCGAGRDGRDCPGHRRNDAARADDSPRARRALAVVSPRSLGAILRTFAVWFMVAMLDFLLVIVSTDDRAGLWHFVPTGSTMETIEFAWDMREVGVAADHPRLADLTDQWGAPLRFEDTDDGWRVGSLGHDRAVGGRGADRDLWMDERGEASPPTYFDLLRSDLPRIAATIAAFHALWLTLALGALSVFMRALGDGTANERLGCGLFLALVALLLVHVSNMLALVPPR